jgi:hypothetical protein
VCTIQDVVRVLATWMRGRDSSLLQKDMWDAAGEEPTGSALFAAGCGAVLVRVRIIFFISSSGGRELIFFALTQIE